MFDVICFLLKLAYLLTNHGYKYHYKVLQRDDNLSGRQLYIGCPFFSAVLRFGQLKMLGVHDNNMQNENIQLL